MQMQSINILKKLLPASSNTPVFLNPVQFSMRAMLRPSKLVSLPGEPTHERIFSAANLLFH